MLQTHMLQGHIRSYKKMESVEQLILVQYTHELCNGIAQDPVEVTQKLFAKGLVSEAQVSASLSLSQDAYSKASALVQVIRRRVVTPEDFQDFLSVLEKCQWLDNVVLTMKRQYETKKTDTENQYDVKELARENKVKLEIACGFLIADVAAKLEKMGIDFQLFQSCVAAYTKDDQLKASTIAGTLQALTRTTKWKCDSIIALEEICRKFGQENEDLMKKIYEYKSNLAGFRATTKIIDFIECMKQDQEESSGEFESPLPTKQALARHDNKYFHNLSLKLRARVTENSLDYVDQLWSSLSDYLYLPALPALLKQICDGCVEITWSIPTVIAEVIKERAQMIKRFAETNLDIVAVTLNHQLLYGDDTHLPTTNQELKFYIAVGKDYDHYLQVTPLGEINLLCGVKAKHDASHFRVEKCDHSKYLLAFDIGEDTLYMARNLPVEPTGMFSLQMGEQYPVEFTLHSPGPDNTATDLKTWRDKPCYVKIGSGYGAYNADEEVFEFTEGSAVNEDAYWHCCQLQPLEIAGDGMLAPGGPKPGQRTTVIRKNRPKKKATSIWK